MSEWVLTVFLVVTELVCLVGAILLAKRNKGFLTFVFFAFGVASGLLSSLFWITYDLLRPEVRMPFAANEIGEWALFLLFASCLTTLCPARTFLFRREILFTSLFAAASAALWIGWSGEWVEDILTGLCYGWFLCCTVGALKHSGELKRGAWIALGAGALLLISGQTATFFVPEGAVFPIEIFCYVLMFSAVFFFILRTILAFKNGRAGVAPAFAVFACSLTTMYMSGAGFYHAALAISALSLPTILFALRREVEKA